MVAFPNCKINIGLRITGKRTDGFHDIETIFYPIPLKDVIEIIPVNGTASTFSQTGLAIPDNGDKDLCVQAYELLKADHPEPRLTFTCISRFPLVPVWVAAQLMPLLCLS